MFLIMSVDTVGLVREGLLIGVYAAGNVSGGTHSFNVKFE